MHSTNSNIKVALLPQPPQHLCSSSHHCIHISPTMGPPNGAEHSKPKPVIKWIIKKCLEDDVPKLITPSEPEAPATAGNAVEPQ